MDSFFDYIVIIFFIVSAIASMLKSKKKKEQEAQQQAVSAEEQAVPTQTTASQPVRAEKKRVIDPFEDSEMFGGKKQNAQAYQQKKQGYSFKELKSEVDKYFEDALLKSQEAETVIPQPAAKSQSSVISQPAPSKKPEVRHTSLKERTIMDIHVQPGKSSNKRAENIRGKIRNNTELKDMIVISEILGKPKALRK